MLPKGGSIDILHGKSERKPCFSLDDLATTANNIREQGREKDEPCVSANNDERQQQALGQLAVPRHSMHRHNGSFVLATKPAVGVAPRPFAFFNFPFWGDRCAAKIVVLNRRRERRTQPHVMLEIPS
ncbi:hypothetical protein NC652_036561 [Populus alba x Populus x berolinensis]|nr:hypothetical protein NC652_036561 [Populus alba x Populus x berolinensis]